MTYTTLAVTGVVVAALADLLVFRTRLLTRRLFWVSYAIIVVFQLLTNGVLTGFRIVRYDGAAIIGSSTPVDRAPPLIGDGRLVFAPVEDLLFGFSLVLLTLVLWVFWGRRGLQRTPYSGPPAVRFPGARVADRSSRAARTVEGPAGTTPTDQSDPTPGTEPAAGEPGAPPRG